MATKEVTFPVTLANFPYPRRINPFYEEVGPETDVWVQSFEPFDKPEVMQAFLRCDFPLFTAFSYPSMDRDTLRLASDMLDIFFVFDEHTDVADDTTAQKLADILVDALRNPDQPRPDGENAVGEMARNFWGRLRKVASDTYLRRALPLWERYAQSVVQEAKDRNANYIRDLESFHELRRNTVGVFPCAAMNYLLTEIPDEVLDHPTMQRLTLLTVELLMFENDMFSFQKEDAADEPHNMLTVFMHARKASLQEAIDWSAEEIKKRAHEFIELEKQRFWKDPALDQAVQEYIQGLGALVRGHTCWGLEGYRYFGKDDEVKKSRTLVLSDIKQKFVCWESAEERV